MLKSLKKQSKATKKIEISKTIIQLSILSIVIRLFAVLYSSAASTGSMSNLLIRSTSQLLLLFDNSYIFVHVYFFLLFVSLSLSFVLVAAETCRVVRRVN